MFWKWCEVVWSAGSGKCRGELLLGPIWVKRLRRVNLFSLIANYFQWKIFNKNKVCLKESQDLNRISCYNSGREPFGALSFLSLSRSTRRINLFLNLFKREARASRYCKLNVQFELNWDVSAKAERGEQVSRMMTRIHVIHSNISLDRWMNFLSLDILQ